ncbi:MAG TPA: hypothetical protein VG125_21665 [Pirellulales bacterium]|jgi:YD repeat-containing protein|nr:hypothetical protein [Pirellulales bacterium]
MPGCTLLTAGIPNPLPSKPMFLYLDKDGRPVPPPNYVPNLNDCHDSGCGCGCSGGGGNSTLNPACGDDPGVKQLEAVNAIVRMAAQELAVNQIPGWLEIWDGGQGNLLRQYSMPTVDALAPTPVFTYNSIIHAQPSGLGQSWNMIFAQSVVSINSTTAVINKGTGTSFTYTSKNATTGVYTAPAGALNKLLQNADNTWTETQPDGLTLNYNTSGRLATIKRASYTWTITYDSNNNLKTIKDPVARVATFGYSAFGMPPLIRKFVDVVGRITTFTGTVSPAFITSIIDPLNRRTTFTQGSFPNLISNWKTPDGNQSSYVYNGSNQLTSATDPSGNQVQVGYATNQNHYLDPNSNRTTYSYTSSGQPRAIQNALGQRATLLWTSGQLTTAIDTAGNRTTLTYATISDGRKFVSSLQTPKGDRYTWLYDASDRVRATIDPLGNRNSFSWDSTNNRTGQLDALGHRTSFLYNSGGQLRAVIMPLGQRTTALFDSTDRVKALIDPLGNRTTFTYNALSQPDSLTTPTGRGKGDKSHY